MSSRNKYALGIGAAASKKKKQFEDR